MTGYNLFSVVHIYRADNSFDPINIPALAGFRSGVFYAYIAGRIVRYGYAELSIAGLFAMNAVRDEEFFWECYDTLHAQGDVSFWEGSMSLDIRLSDYMMTLVMEDDLRFQ